MIKKIFMLTLVLMVLIVGCAEKTAKNESIKGKSDAGTESLNDKRTADNATKRIGLMVGLRTGEKKYSTYYFSQKDNDSKLFVENGSLVIPIKEEFINLNLNSITLKRDEFLIPDKENEFESQTYDFLTLWKNKSQSEKFILKERNKVSQNDNKELGNKENTPQSYKNRKLGIKFVGNDYISMLISNSNYTGGNREHISESFKTFRIDDLSKYFKEEPNNKYEVAYKDLNEFPGSPIKISDIYGKDSFQKLKDYSIIHFRNLPKEDKDSLAKEISDESRGIEWGISRSDGLWAVSGFLSNKFGSGYPSGSFFDSDIDPNKSIVGYNKLSHNLDILKVKNPKTIDAFSSPQNNLIVFLEQNKLLFFNDYNIGQAISPFHVEVLDTNEFKPEVVMVQWCSDENFDIWEKEATKKFDGAKTKILQNVKNSVELEEILSENKKNKNIYLEEILQENRKNKNIYLEASIITNSKDLKGQGLEKTGRVLKMWSKDDKSKVIEKDGYFPGWYLSHDSGRTDILFNTDKGIRIVNLSDTQRTDIQMGNSERQILTLELNPFAVFHTKFSVLDRDPIKSFKFIGNEIIDNKDCYVFNGILDNFSTEHNKYIHNADIKMYVDKSTKYPYKILITDLKSNDESVQIVYNDIELNVVKDDDVKIPSDLQYIKTDDFIKTNWK